MPRHFRGFTQLTTSKRRTGYTLIEMLIASVLVAALMSVVWNMMSMYNGYLSAGQAQAVEQQLIRSVLFSLEEDLQRVAIPDTNPVVVSSFESIDDVTGDAVGERSAESKFELSETFDPFSIGIDETSLFNDAGKSQKIPSPGRISLAGNSYSMRLSIEAVVPEQILAASDFSDTAEPDSGASSLPPQNALPAFDSATLNEDSLSIEGVAPDVPEFRTIIWQFEPFGVTPSGPTSLRSGLYRIETDSLSLQTALSQQETVIGDAGQNDETSVDRMTLEALLFPLIDNRQEPGNMATDGTDIGIQVPQFDVIPEIVGCRFEYFNGSMWMSSWNSEQQLGLPLAVRIQLHLVTQDLLEKLNSSFSATDETDDLLNDALNARANTGDSATFSPANEDPAADPFASIKTRLVERIIIMQPLVGNMPEPGDLNDSSALPNSDNPPQPETLL